MQRCCGGTDCSGYLLNVAVERRQSALVAARSRNSAILVIYLEVDAGAVDQCNSPVQLASRGYFFLVIYRRLILERMKLDLDKIFSSKEKSSYFCGQESGELNVFFLFFFSFGSSYGVVRHQLSVHFSSSSSNWLMLGLAPLSCCNLTSQR